MSIVLLVSSVLLNKLFGHSFSFVFRHILCEIIFPEDGKKRSVTQKDVAMAITNEIMEMHGDYGIGATRKMPPLQGVIRVVWF